MDVIKDMDGCDKRIWMDMIKDMDGSDKGYGWM